MKNKEYFTKIKQEYKKASEYSGELYQNIAARLNKILFGKVLDFGNGGVINYDTKKIKKLICADIINKNKKITSKKIDFVYGDFYNIDFSGKFDFVLAQFLLHHLPNDKKLISSVKKIGTKLNKDGKLVIVEIVVPRHVEVLQNSAKPFVYPVLRAMKKPCLRFFSLKSLAFLLKSCGFRDIKVQRVSIGKKVSPAPVLFPRLRIPGKLYPFKCVLIEAKK